MSVRLSTRILLAVGSAILSTGPGYAESRAARAECDRLIDMIHGMPPGQAHDALQTMQIHRRGSRYQACVSVGKAAQRRSTVTIRVPARNLADLKVWTDSGIDLGDVNEVVRGANRRNYVVVTYRGPRWPGNKQIALPLERMRLEGERLLISGVDDDSLLHMPTFDEDTGQYTVLRGDQTVSLQGGTPLPTTAGRQP